MSRATEPSVTKANRCAGWDMRRWKIGIGLASVSNRAS
jgi:hypothetical protein